MTQANESPPDITVHPLPTDEELAAIVAILEVLREGQPEKPANPPSRSRWAEAARREALRDGGDR
jgi:hypothetical protein